MPAAQAPGFVSGLLIGNEFAAAAAGQARSVAIIGSPALAARYAVAARHFDLSCEVLDPHQVYRAAVSTFIPTFVQQG
jgi:2-dehydro-3-deoxygalactonokinase